MQESDECPCELHDEKTPRLELEVLLRAHMMKSQGRDPYVLSREEEGSRIAEMADGYCREKHPQVYDSIIGQRANHVEMEGPPCTECIEEVRRAMQTPAPSH